MKNYGFREVKLLPNLTQQVDDPFIITDHVNGTPQQLPSTTLENSVH